MADLAAQVQGLLSQVFSSGGIAGVPLSSRALLELRQAGGYDPASASVSASSYYNPTSGEFDASDAQEILLISEPLKSQIASDGSIQSYRKLMILPLKNLRPGDLIGGKIHYAQEDFQIIQASSQEMRGQALLWNLICQ